MIESSCASTTVIESLLGVRRYLGRLTTEDTENTELETERNRFIKKFPNSFSFLCDLCVLRGE